MFVRHVRILTAAPDCAATIQGRHLIEEGRYMVIHRISINCTAAYIAKALPVKY